jgi:hypothetical protein
VRAFVDRVQRGWGAWWDGDVSAWPLALFRVGLALLVLARVSGAGAALGLPLDHDAWVRGLEYAPSSEPAVPPLLHAPLVPMPRLPDVVLELLAISRIVLAAFLLVGLWPRAAALALGLVGWGLMAYDRHRYLHHLHLLWVSCGWLALAPSDARLSLVRRLRGRPLESMVPRWSLQLLRLQLLVCYAGAGLAKLRADWLSGEGLRAAERSGLFHGPLWRLGRAELGHAGVAVTVCGVELALVALLAIRRTRLAGVVLAVAFHAALDASMTLSTFTAVMLLYVALFLPWREDVPSGSPRPPPPR